MFTYSDRKYFLSLSAGSTNNTECFFMAASTAECALDSQVVNLTLQEHVPWESKDRPLQEFSITLTPLPLSSTTVFRAVSDIKMPIT